jgi:hypothetical protein
MRRSHYPRRNVSLCNGVGGWVVPIAVLDALQNGKLPCLTTTSRRLFEM